MTEEKPHRANRDGETASRALPAIGADAAVGAATGAGGGGGAGTGGGAARRPTVLEQVGGAAGFAYSAVPVVVFVTATAFLPLPVTIGVALAVGLGLTVFRVWRGERIASAVGSLAGVAVAAGVVAWTGSARDFFAVGIWASLAGFVVTLATVLARRPLTGIVWNAVHGGKQPWRSDRAILHAHDLATLAAASVLGARFVVQQWLYLAESTGGLGVARIVMGMPLTVLAALVVVWAFRRSTWRLVRPA